MSNLFLPSGVLRKRCGSAPAGGASDQPHLMYDAPKPGEVLSAWANSPPGLDYACPQDITPMVVQTPSRLWPETPLFWPASPIVEIPGLPKALSPLVMPPCQADPSSFPSRPKRSPPGLHEPAKPLPTIPALIINLEEILPEKGDPNDASHKRSVKRKERRRNRTRDPPAGCDGPEPVGQPAAPSESRRARSRGRARKSKAKDKEKIPESAAASSTDAGLQQPCVGEGDADKQRHLKSGIAKEESKDTSDTRSGDTGSGASAALLSQLKSQVAHKCSEPSHCTPLPPGGMPCSFCSEVVLALPEDAASAQNCFVDNRLACEKCRAIFDPDGFEPKYRVCSNPLCRRKWKQLTPKILTHFCPPCKKQLDDCVAADDSCYEFERESAEQVCKLWHKILQELCQTIVGYPSLRPLPVWFGTRWPATPENTEQSREQWKQFLGVVNEAFLPAPALDDVRNYNSFQNRKVYFRGIVKKAYCKHTCLLQAQTELNEDLADKRLPTSETSLYPIVDWEQSLKDGDVVEFLAFPNPSVTERNTVSRIARLLHQAASSSSAPSRPAKTDLASTAMPMPAAAETVLPQRPHPSSPSKPAKPVRPLSLDKICQREREGAKAQSAPARYASPTIEFLCLPKVSYSEPADLLSTRSRTSTGGSLDSSCVVSPCSADFVDAAFADLIGWSNEDGDISPPTRRLSQKPEIEKVDVPSEEDSAAANSRLLDRALLSQSLSSLAMSQVSSPASEKHGSSPIRPPLPSATESPVSLALVPRGYAAAVSSSGFVPKMAISQSRSPSQTSSPPGMSIAPGLQMIAQGKSSLSSSVWCGKGSHKGTPSPTAWSGKGSLSPKGKSGRGSPSPAAYLSARPGRSPMPFPRSPTASYFDD